MKRDVQLVTRKWATAKQQHMDRLRASIPHSGPPVPDLWQREVVRSMSLPRSLLTMRDLGIGDTIQIRLPPRFKAGE